MEKRLDGWWKVKYKDKVGFAPALFLMRYDQDVNEDKLHATYMVTNMAEAVKNSTMNGTVKKEDTVGSLAQDVLRAATLESALSSDRPSRPARPVVKQSDHEGIPVYVCVSMRMYICEYMCMYVYLCGCTYVYICVCMCIYADVHMCIYVYVCVSMQMYICVYMCMYVYLCRCTYVYICVCMCIYADG